jgi:signal transduction histidine kinase/ActR/RegA family two-component response regulator
MDKKSDLEVLDLSHPPSSQPKPVQEASPSHTALRIQRQDSRSVLIAKQAEIDAAKRVLTAERETIARTLIANDEAGMRDLKAEREATARRLIHKDEQSMRDLKTQREVTAIALIEKDQAQTSTEALIFERQTTARALIAKEKADMRDLIAVQESDARALIAEQESTMRHITAEREVAARALIQKDEQRQISLMAKESRKQQALFIDTMCHEIRNPINGILGTVEIMRDQIANMEQQIQNNDHLSPKSLLRNLKELRQSIDDIEECGNHQRIIANDVLARSTLEQERLQLENTAMNLTHVLRHILHPYETIIANQGLTMEIDLFPTEIYILGDQNRLKQIICNLLNNSIKFTSVGFIRISALSHGVDENNQQIFEIGIADSGIGMSPEEAQRVFLPYTQANAGIANQYGGTGLGLVISQELAKLMKGHIGITSQEGIGTEFKLHFSAKVISTEEYLRLSRPNSQKSIQPSVDATRRKKILVVEDNRINQKVLVKMLDKAGYNCDVAKNGLEAVESYKSYKHVIILMDMQMPKMNGIEATKKIREIEVEQRLVSAYIICISGNAREEQQAEALDAGADVYLVKPINREQVLSLIDAFYTNPMQEGKNVEAT